MKLKVKAHFTIKKKTKEQANINISGIATFHEYLGAED